MLSITSSSSLTAIPGCKPIMCPMHGRAPTLTPFPAIFSHQETFEKVRYNLLTYIRTELL